MSLPNSKKVIFVIHGLPMGGAEKFLITLANQLYQLSYQPHLILLSKDDSLKSELNKEIPVYYALKNTRFDFGVSKKIKKWIDIIDPHVVVCINTYSFFLTKLNFFLSSKYRFVLSPHTTKPFSFYNYLQNLFYFRLLNKSDSIFYLCKAQQQYLKQKYYLSKHLEKVVYNGINAELFNSNSITLDKARAAKLQLGIGEADSVIVQVARIQKEKRHADAIDAVALLNKKREKSSVHLLLVGDGNPIMLTALKQRVKDLNIEQLVHFLGNQKDVRLFYKMANLFTLTSNSETFSIAALEAMSFGLPVVLTDVGGAREMVLDNKNGFLVPPKQVEKIAEGWRTALSFDFNAAKIREEVVNKFGLDHMVDSYVRLLFSDSPNQQHNT
jgi:glycosyltransferase involved in cell wall biosynthesis